MPALFIIALIVALVKPATDNIYTVARKIQAELNAAENVFNRAIQDKTLFYALQKGDVNKSVIKLLQKQKVLLYQYKNDSLVFWTNSNVVPASTFAGIEDGTSLIKLKNGWYACSKWSDSVSREVILGLVSVKYDYPFENKFLQNEFAFSFKVPGNVSLSEAKINGSVAVRNSAENILFYLYVLKNEKDNSINILLLLSQIVVLVLLLYFIRSLSIYILRTKGFVFSLSVFVFFIVAVRAVMLFFDIPKELNKLPIFDPKYYASSAVTKSLGDLLINVLLFAWIVFFARNHYYRTSVKELPRAIKILLLALLFVYTGFIFWVFKTLVMDSVISFEVYNILSLNFYSLAGMFCLALLFLIHFLCARAVLIHLSRTTPPNTLVIVASIVFGLVFAAIGFFYPFSDVVCVTAFWTTLTIILLWFIFRKNTSTSIRSILLSVSLYSILSTFIIENLYEKKEHNARQFFSGKLVSERDYVAEYMFNDVAKRINEDPLIRSFFIQPIISQKEVTDRITVLYLSGYFNKYNFQLYAFGANGNAKDNPDSLPMNYFKTLIARDTASKNEQLRYISDSSLNYSYLSVLPFYADTQYLGLLVLRLIPKVYFGQNVYPELLLGNNIAAFANSTNYYYAIYQNNQLVAQYGDYPYSYYWNKDFKFDEDDFVFVQESKWQHSIQRFANGKKVIVTVARKPFFEPVATFSYLFSFYFLLLTVLWGASRVAIAYDKNRSLISYFMISFRARINLSMFLMILFSFVIIGAVTVGFFKRQYDNFYTDRLLRKEKVIHTVLEYFMQKNTEGRNLLNKDLNGGLNLEIARLADVHAIDINLFDRNANLAISSQPVIYDKGIISRKMNPYAYFSLANNKTAQAIEQESIGGLKYLAVYTPVRNNRGETIAYLGIPYFERSKNISDEVSSFLVALMNVYVFLMICAAILAYFISNSITEPLTAISRKLRVFNLHEKNEPITWNTKDEIGVLVDEYNKMISELEENAQKLAKSERETAWREMAKQIAHEIKNPLTPMKLSIQHLQRAIDEGSPNVDQLAHKVTKTLEEQIENLSSIATAFSSFAQMPKANKEIINLNELLASICELFSAEEKTTVTFSTEAKSPLVSADKNQLVSVFNNLMKNAVQSIPESRKGFVEIHVKEENGCIIVSVSDNGSGIPKENYSKVFVPNFTTKSSGTGLGLAISRQIIEGAGGKIWFETTEPAGTTFFVKLVK